MRPVPPITVPSCVVLLLGLLGYACGGGEGGGIITPGPAPVALVTLSPATAELEVGSSVQLSTVLTDATGGILTDREVSWTTSRPAVASVSGEGLVEAAGAGVAFITAASEGKSATSTITVRGVPPPVEPVASVTVSPPTVLLENRGPEGGTRQLVANALDANGNPVPGAPVVWSSSDEAVATVSPSGLVLGRLQGQATITALAEGHTGTSEITVILLFGIPVPVPVSGGHSFVSLSASGLNTCGLAASGAMHCWGNGATHSITFGTPAPTFSSVASGGSLGGDHMCALTPAGQAYCWGDNGWGQLGNGSKAYTEKPEPVTGDLTFAYLSTGQSHSCGLTTAGKAYCWGLNFAGELGTGDPSGDDATSLVPVPVAGELRFETIGTGDDQTCGLTAAGKAYCWGENDNGEVGDGTRVNRLAPVAVTGGRTFTSLAVGGEHTCGLTASGAVYCWGSRNQGTIAPRPDDQLIPTLVSDQPAFASIAAGGAHDCALTSAGVAYCWGLGFFGQLGDRSGNNRPTPSPVYGDLAFTAITVGGSHSCGLRPSGAAFCWGHNENGELGQ